jgi:hypothetical protein
LNITIPVSLNPFSLCHLLTLQREEISRHAWLQEDAQAIDTLIAPPTETHRQLAAKLLWKLP